MNCGSTAHGNSQCHKGSGSDTGGPCRPQASLGDGQQPGEGDRRAMAARDTGQQVPAAHLPEGCPETFLGDSGRLCRGDLWVSENLPSQRRPTPQSPSRSFPTHIFSGSESPSVARGSVQHPCRDPARTPSSRKTGAAAREPREAPHPAPLLRSRTPGACGRSQAQVRGAQPAETAVRQPPQDRLLLA